MKHEVVLSFTGSFESHAQETEGVVEVWLARDLQRLLGYSEWRKYGTVSLKVKAICEISANRIQNHFVDGTKMVSVAMVVQMLQFVQEMVK